MDCEIKKGESVCNHVQRTPRYVERLIRLNVHFDEELAIDMVLNSLPSCYDQFILAYHLNNIETTLAQLHNLLQIDESGMKGKNSATSTNYPALVIGQGKGSKGKAAPKANLKNKAHVRSSSNSPKPRPNSNIPGVSDPKEATCYYCNDKGH